MDEQPKRADDEDQSSPQMPEIVIAPSQTFGLSTAVEDKTEQAAKALPALGKALAEPMARFFDNLTQDGKFRPHEIEVQLGLSFEGGTKWAIVATVGATVDVKLKWSSEKV